MFNRADLLNQLSFEHCYCLVLLLGGQIGQLEFEMVLDVGLHLGLSDPVALIATGLVPAALLVVLVPAATVGLPVAGGLVPVAGAGPAATVVSLHRMHLLLDYKLITPDLNMILA